MPDERWDGKGNYLDWLMRLDPLEYSAQNIDEIIDIQRKARMRSDSGIKPKKRESEAIDLVELDLAPKSKPMPRRKMT